jgi:hypothetical protein
MRHSIGFLFPSKQAPIRHFFGFVGSECHSLDGRILRLTHIVIASYQESDICVFSRVYLRGSINLKCRARIQTFCVKAIY